MLGSANVYHLFALGGTLIVEGVGMALWATIAAPHNRRALGNALITTIIVNLIAHTLFWYSQPLFAPFWPWGLYGAELLVVMVEGAAYAHLLVLPGLSPWLLSFCLNLASFLAGLWMWQSMM